MKFGIFTNLNRDIKCNACKRFTDILDKKNVEYLVCDNAKEYYPNNKLNTIDEVIKFCDLMIVFGGDGTMLNISSKCTPLNKKIFGINMGKIGFLTEIDQSEIQLAVEKLIDNDFTVEDRLVLKIEVNNNSYYAINEVLLSSIDNCHVVSVDIDIDNIFADKVRGDGVLVSTPTGSTAYSLACNGPILSPSVDALLINMVCPHTLHSCPLVIDGDSVVTLRTQSGNMKMLIDGKVINTFKENVIIKVSKSNYKARFIRLKNINFYHKLLQKLSYWGD